jgi:hypothetical protein
MEESRVKIYVKSLERKISDDHHFLKEAVEELRDLCRVVSPDKNVPQGIIVDIREVYKGIQNRFKEVKGIQQLLQGKYRQYYRRDPIRDKDLLEIGFVAKTTFSRFEENLKLFLDRQKAKEREETAKKSQKAKIIEWFQSREKQLALLRSMRILKELHYQAVPGDPGAELRKIGGVRSFTLFLLRGDEATMDTLQARIRLREHDFIERTHQGELRGVYTHLREVHPTEIEGVFRSLLEREGLTAIRCLLIPVQPQGDLNPEILDSLESFLQEMKGGEVKSILI